MVAKISIVVALGRNGVHNNAIGKDNKLLWHIPDDLKRFKSITKGHPIIMGRKTFISIGRALPERTNIILSRHADWIASNVHIRRSLDEAIDYAQSLNKEEIFIIGGGEIYTQALPHTDKLYLTLIDDEKDADSYFPEYEKEFTKKTFEEEHEWNGIKYKWVNLER